MNSFIPHPYQQDCINAVIERPGVALWLEMGLGKTVVTLTAIATLLQLDEVSKVLIVAPRKWRKQPGRTKSRNGNTCNGCGQAQYWGQHSSASGPC